MSNLLYPPSPANVNPAILSPSLAFKRQVGVVVSSIILFFLVYIILVSAAAGLAVASFYLGVWLIIEMPKIIILMVGLGLMALGISVVFFLVKFIFSIAKNQNDFRIEIDEKDQPQLFSFIRTLTEETKTPFPKKIYLSGEVNASVFYNSSFWSMFLPVRKNLEVGLGLVNSINISEFKAVIAHEFGHFSQRSMKLGSFTYNVNQIIYNMLYDNTGYNNFLRSWGKVNFYFSFFAVIAVKIAGTIQWVLRQMYNVINKNYLALSREMEFHADAVAASVSGGNNLVSALSRIELASSCYNTALSNADNWFKQNKASKNIFANQSTIFRSVAKEHSLPLRDGLPDISYQFIQSFSQSRINFKNQWASHPTLEERKTHLDRLQTEISPDQSSAWEIFADRQTLQEQMTANLYKNVKFGENVEHLDGQYFDDWYSKERDLLTLPILYKGFYDNRYINFEDHAIDLLINSPGSKTFDELFNDENGQIQSSIANNENDIATIKAIQGKQIDVKSFDFDGTRYKISDCVDVIKELEGGIGLLTNKQKALDKEAFVFFYQKANENKGQLVSLYAGYQSICNLFNAYVEVANGVFNSINPFYQDKMSIDDIQSAVKSLKLLHEIKIKQVFEELVNDKIITTESKDDLYNRVKSFTTKNYTYFAFDTFRNEELTELYELTLKAGDELNNIKFKAYKNLLEKQLQFYLDDQEASRNIL